MTAAKQPPLLQAGALQRLSVNRRLVRPLPLMRYFQHVFSEKSEQNRTPSKRVTANFKTGQYRPFNRVVGDRNDASSASQRTYGRGYQCPGRRNGGFSRELGVFKFVADIET